MTICNGVNTGFIAWCGTLFIWEFGFIGFDLSLAVGLRWGSSNACDSCYIFFHGVISKLLPLLFSLSSVFGLSI